MAHFQTYFVVRSTQINTRERQGGGKAGHLQGGCTGPPAWTGSAAAEAGSRSTRFDSLFRFGMGFLHFPILTLAPSSVITSTNIWNWRYAGGSLGANAARTQGRAQRIITTVQYLGIGLLDSMAGKTQKGQLQRDPLWWTKYAPAAPRALYAGHINQYSYGPVCGYNTCLPQQAGAGESRMQHGNVLTRLSITRALPPPPSLLGSWGGKEGDLGMNAALLCSTSVLVRCLPCSRSTST